MKAEFVKVCTTGMVKVNVAVPRLNELSVNCKTAETVAPLVLFTVNANPPATGADPTASA